MDYFNESHPSIQSLRLQFSIDERVPAHLLAVALAQTDVFVECAASVTALAVAVTVVRFTSKREYEQNKQNRFKSGILRERAQQANAGASPQNTVSILLGVCISTRVHEVDHHEQKMSCLEEVKRYR